jgi:hypothetical protein
MWRYPAAIVLGVVAMATIQRFWPMEWPGWLGFAVSITAMLTAFDVVGVPDQKHVRPRRRVWAWAAGFATTIAIAYLMHRLFAFPA